MATVNEFSNYKIFPNKSPIGEVATVSKHEECNAYNDYLQPVLTCNNINISTVLITNNVEQNFDSICYEVAQNVETNYLDSFNSFNTANGKTSENLDVSVSQSMEMNFSQSHSSNNEFRQQKMVKINDCCNQNIFHNNNSNELASKLSYYKESNVHSGYLQPVFCQGENINPQLLNSEREQNLDSICYEVAQNNDSIYHEIFSSDSTTYDEISQYYDASNSSPNDTSNSQSNDISNSHSNEINQSHPNVRITSVSKPKITQRLVTHLSCHSRHRLETIVFLSTNVCLLLIS